LITRHLAKYDIAVLTNEYKQKMQHAPPIRSVHPQRITNQAHQSVKNIDTRVDKGSSNTNADSRAKKVSEAYDKAKNARPGSITAKANMVRDFDERNKKK